MEGSGEGYWLGHRERLRLRAEADGLEALRPHELLELVLFYAVPRVDTADVARAIAESGRNVALYTGNDDNIVSDLLTVHRFTVNGEEKRVPTVGGLLGHWGAWTSRAVEIFREIRSLPEDAPIPV